MQCNKLTAVCGMAVSAVIITSGVHAGDKTAGAKTSPWADLQKEEERYAMLTLSQPIEKAILKAGHAARIVFISDVIMGTSVHGKRLMIITVGLASKGNRSFEEITHHGFVITSGRDMPITVYQDDGLLSATELYNNWIADSEYRLPVGKGLTKILEISSTP